MERRVKVHCITNPVTMQEVANLILAAGGTAIMAQDPGEVEEITSISSVTLINTGVPDEDRWKAAFLAAKQANREGHPVILDPVGAGASAFRKKHLKMLLEEVFFSVIRCNQEEAAALLGLLDQGRDLPVHSGGVESALVLDADQRRALAEDLAKVCGCCVYMSGSVDVVADGRRICEISGGDDRITRITGSGCMLSALCALFAAEDADTFAAVCRAGRLWRACAQAAGETADGKAGEAAGRAAGGMGTFYTELMDAIDLARNFRAPHKEGRGNIRSEQLAVYAVTSENWLTEGQTLVEPVADLLAAGVTCVQLREKEVPDEVILCKARDLKELCHLYRVPLIINDRPDLALASGADGVHVGLSDMGVEKARSFLGKDFIIGASAHNVEEALAAQRAGADYIGCGAVFGSRTKKDVTGLSVEELGRICRAVEIPVVAIGGITPENAAQLQDTGISGVAVISALFQAEDKREAVEAFFNLFKE